ncbi:hypothetical protein [Flavobacterium luteum]|uniref:Uncharacterized protein n=1 Tax=Flavobacterium luteum TaxID=2026654 RepID=A0A7J5AJE1_9FLAO|nr:hypothetical protein [Flavobacterium luteum]KAB1157704.1 hypothetical protein F6464_01065 [Flavobacterium luteum]
METENWINEVLNSTNGMMKVEPNDSLFSKIQNRMQLKNSVSSKTLWLVAASIAILLALNISAIVKSQSKTENKIEYSLSITLDKSNQLY